MYVFAGIRFLIIIGVHFRLYGLKLEGGLPAYLVAHGGELPAEVAKLNAASCTSKLSRLALT